MRQGIRGASAAALVFACALTLAAAPSSAATKPASGRAHASIVGGGPANPVSWPYVVAIYRKDHLHCGGSVIAPTKVLTAAHCVEGFNLANFVVIAGRPNLRDTSVGQSIGIAAGQVHPDFVDTGMHDMAVLTLAQPTTAQPIVLASAAEDAAATVEGALLQVAGWGAQNPLGIRLSAILKRTTERVRATRRCLRAYTPDLFKPLTMICALGRRLRRFGRPAIHTSACSGDSGGPLVAQTPVGVRQVGIVSFGGALCGLPGSPTAYSRVASGLDFIATG